MCGIVCVFDTKQKNEVIRPQILEMSKKIRHRGPDWSGIYQHDNVIFSHERLAIVDPTSGKQPLFTKDKKVALAVNGEIYNHQELWTRYSLSCKTNSVTETLLHLYI